MVRIHNIELANLVNGRLDYTASVTMKNKNGGSLYCKTPFAVDIDCDKLIIYFYRDDCSFERVYSFEKVYPAKMEGKSKREKLEKRCYKLTFNNPRDSEAPISRYVKLDRRQNLRFFLFRVWKWIRKKENLLWITNILVLLLNAIAIICTCKCS